MKAGADPHAVDKRAASPRDYVQAKRLTWILTDEQAEALDVVSRLLMETRNTQVSLVEHRSIFGVGVRLVPESVTCS